MIWLQLELDQVFVTGLFIIGNGPPSAPHACLGLDALQWNRPGTFCMVGIRLIPFIGDSIMWLWCISQWRVTYNNMGGCYFVL